MTNEEKILKILKDNNGIVTTKEVEENNIDKIYLTRLVKKGIIDKIKRGLYVSKNSWGDEYFNLVYGTTAIYSYETALYLLGLCESVPLKYNLSVPRGYNASLNYNDKVILHSVKREYLEIGKVNIKSPQGQMITCYNAERTICDLLKDKQNQDIETLKYAISEYLKDKKSRDLPKLTEYANNLEPQDIMQMYFFERLLYRISISEYKYNFILKGGLLLSAIFGDERRTTQDMDTMIKGLPMDIKQLTRIIKKIVSIDCNDDIKFEVLTSKDIRLDDIYGGIRIKLIGYKEHLQVPLFIDITVGDPITPRELEFKYKCMFDDSYINIMAFNLETIIAEKFETFITDNIINTRNKDFYDLYMILENYYSKLNKEQLIKAIKNTFERRNVEFDIDKIKSNFEAIKISDRLKHNFENFKVKKEYAKNISYEEIMNKINIIIELLSKELVEV